MKVNEIERLLARYYDGETSDTEEKELKRFFTEEDVPAHLLAEKETICRKNLWVPYGSPGLSGGERRGRR